MQARDSFAVPSTFVDNGDPVIKTGRQYLESIRDRRTVFLDGGAVHDVTTHPAYRNAAATVARLYDFQAAPENVAYVQSLFGDAVQQIPPGEIGAVYMAYEEQGRADVADQRTDGISEAVSTKFWYEWGIVVPVIQDAASLA